jgi:hypothetical protein
MCLIFVDLTRCVMILQMTPNVPSIKSHYDDDDLEDYYAQDQSSDSTNG